MILDGFKEEKGCCHQCQGTKRNLVTDILVGGVYCNIGVSTSHKVPPQDFLINVLPTYYNKGTQERADQFMMSDNTKKLQY